MKAKKRYSLLRIEELKTKVKMHRKIKESLICIKNLKQTLPKIQKYPSPEQNQEETEELSKIERKIQKRNQDSHSEIEDQLAEIQEKLKSLQ